MSSGAAAADLAGLTTAAPPPDLRARVLAEIATTRQLSPLPGAVVRLADRRRSRPLMATLAVAAAVACFVVGAVVVGGFGRDGGFDDTVAAIMLEPGAQVAQLSGDGQRHHHGSRGAATAPRSSATTCPCRPTGRSTSCG